LARQVCRRSPSYIQNTLIVGADELGRLVARKLIQHPEYGLNIVGFVDTQQPPASGGPAGEVHHPGAPGQLGEILEERDVERVVIAGHVAATSETEMVHLLKAYDVQVDIVARLFDVVGPGVGIHNIEGVPMLGLPPTRLSRTSLFLKRTI